MYLDGNGPHLRDEELINDKCCGGSRQDFSSPGSYCALLCTNAAGFICY